MLSPAASQRLSAERLIIRHVPAWFHDQEETLRAGIRRDVQRFLGRAAAESVLPRLESEPLERLRAVWYRIPYAESFEELFDSQWSLGVEPLSMSDLLRAGFGRPLRWGLFLELPGYRSSAVSRKALLTAVPWLDLLKNSETLLTALRHRGWLLFHCPDERKALRLQTQVRGSVLRCSVLGSTRERPD